MSEGQSGELEKAVHDLERAEEHLAKAKNEEMRAEREIADAVKVVEREEKRHEVEVHVIHVNEVERASFRERLTATLQQVWDRSYKELKIERRPRDVFQTQGEHPKSLMNDLNLTLEEAREGHVIKDFRFGIASETGGARP